MIVNKKSIYHSKNLDHDYYNRQLLKPYESTITFFNFLNNKVNLKDKKIIDLACGNGANLIYLKKNYDVAECYGIDQNKTLLKKARIASKKKHIKDLHFINKNIKDYKSEASPDLFCDGVTCIQTLSVLDDYKETILFAKKLRAKFICVNSLFWNGDIDFKITVNFLEKKTRKIKKVNHYNIYSISHYNYFLKKNGYKINHIYKFENKKNLRTKNKNLMGSHTVYLNKKKVTKSGPLIMDWYFVLSTKKK
jgi:SAM-dependent methyltransferase